MDTKQNLFYFLGEWWERRQNRQRSNARPTLSMRWLPTPGNVAFTVVLVVGLFWAQNVGALNLGAAAAGTSASTIAYQGRLADSDGTPLTETLNMSFRLYAQASGSTPLWSEQWTGSNGVQVSDGLFNVMLGSLDPIPQNKITGNDTLFLGITVGTDDEMSPRVQLGSVPFAVQALTVPDGSVTAAKISDGTITAAKLAFEPLVSGNGIVPLGGKSLTDIANIDPVGNIYGYGSDDRVEIHMPGGANAGNLYINWHSGRSLVFGGGKGSPQMSVDPDGNLWVKGELQASGAKPALVETENYGTRKLYAVEAPEVRFSDEGMGRLENGTTRIQLDPIFLETIEGNFLVHLTPYSDALLYVSESGDNYFEVTAGQGDPNAEFAWRLSATRKGYVDVRMEEVE